MKKLIASVALAAALAAPAAAADLGPSRSAIAPAIQAPIGSWTGFYLGGHLGLGFSGRFDNNAAIPLGGASGFLGGLQAGYDFQMDRFVAGVAADMSLTTINKRFTPLVGNAFRGRHGTEGSFRVRAGFAVQNNLLLYGTGGLAFGGVSVSEFNPAVFNQSRMAVGWTAGFGGEYKFTPNVSGLVEYRYTDLSRGLFNNLPTTPRVGYEGHAVRTGVNYRF